MTAPSPEPLDWSRSDAVTDVDLMPRARAIVSQAIDELRHAALLKPSRRITRAATGLGVLTAGAALRSLMRHRDLGSTITDLERLESDVGAIKGILQRCASSLRALEDEVAARQPGSSAWWSASSRAVARSLTLGRTDEALSRWAGTWVDGLAMRDWSGCRDFLALEEPATASARDHLRAVTDALDEAVGTPPLTAALDPLDALLDGDAPITSALDTKAAVRLGVLRTRILCGEFSDRRVIREAAQRTVHRAGPGVWRALALTGLAECQLAAGEVEAARETLKKATTVDPPTVDTLVASGILLERDGLWALADEYYDLAVATDGLSTTEPVLLRPIPARLLVRAASSAGCPPARAVELLDRALMAGVPGDGDFPDTAAHEAKAAKLLELAATDPDPVEAQVHRLRAAHALNDAAQRRAWSRETAEAIDLFHRACDLADLAEFRWNLAEALRLAADRSDGTRDLEVLGTARDELERGLGKRSPGVAEAWVLVTQALIEQELPDRHQDPALLVERALITDPSYALAYAFLAITLRRQGFVQEAAEVSRDGRESTTPESLLFDVAIDLATDEQQFDEALQLLDYQALRWPDNQGLSVNRADVLLRMGRPEDALTVLSTEEPTTAVRLTRGHSLFVAGHASAARDEFHALWLDTVVGPAQDIAGWAAFRAGLVGEAIPIYRDLCKRASAVQAFRRDLGQMLLVEGSVDEGAALLRQGIDDCPYVAELRYLATFELDYVAAVTATADHQHEVLAVRKELTDRIERRCQDLLAARRPANTESAVLSEARRALLGERPLEAMAGYATLIGNDEVPEAAGAAVRAGLSARDAADELYGRRDEEGAALLWSAVEQRLVDLPGGLDDGLVLSLACRRILAGLAEGLRDETAAWLLEASDHPGLPQALEDSARTLARHPDILWRLRDGLLALVERTDLGETAHELALRAAHALPLEQVYGLDASAADTRTPMSSYVSPLELRLGRAVADDIDHGALIEATSDLQVRIEAEMGVRIPWVYWVQDRELGPWETDLLLYGASIGETTVTGDPHTWVRHVMGDVEERVRRYLFRLVGVDEVDLWLEGWDSSHPDAPAWEQIDPVADRLRLARVLRLLLREQVSVRDRESIVAALRTSEESDGRRGSETLDTLRAVRRAMGAAMLGIGTDDPVVDLPADLEDRVAEGLRDDRAIWELPRESAHHLVSDLREWLAGLPDVPCAVVVADVRVRPFVWRLLASEQPVVRVLAAEEVS